VLLNKEADRTLFHFDLGVERMDSSLSV